MNLIFPLPKRQNKISACMRFLKKNSNYENCFCFRRGGRSKAAATKDDSEEEEDEEDEEEQQEEESTPKVCKNTTPHPHC